MVLKILTFGVLSVFCVLTAISSVCAHTPANPNYVSFCHKHDDNEHCHSNAVHKHYGLRTDGKENRPAAYHEHYNPNWNHADDHATGETTVWVREEPDTSHTHRLHTHQHDDYVVHTHTGTHSHAYTPGDDDHPHPGLTWGFDHDGVGRRTDTPVDEQPVNQQPVNQPPNNQPTVNQPTVTQPTVTQPTTVGGGPLKGYPVRRRWDLLRQAARRNKRDRRLHCCNPYA